MNQANNRKKKQFSGFTLIELCVVLAITSSVLFLTNLSFTNERRGLEVSRFFYRFEREVKLTQMTALVQGRRTDLTVLNGTILFHRPQSIFLLPPKELKLVSSGQVIIEFGGFTGYSSSTDDLIFEWKEGKEVKRRSYTFKLGGGNYIVQ